MLFESAENRCILEVLRILSRKESHYSELFKRTKASHTTLQRALKKLSEGKFIEKHERGHQNVVYRISEKGKKLFKILNLLNEELI